MTFREEINEVVELQKAGKSVEEVVDWMFFRKKYHTQAITLIVAVYGLERELVEEKVYSHIYYRKFKNEYNPFNEDFLDEFGDQVFNVDGDD